MLYRSGDTDLHRTGNDMIRKIPRITLDIIEI